MRCDAEIVVRSICLQNGRIISSPTRNTRNFYGFTLKLVLHFVGTVRPAPLCSAQECSILVDCPLKQTARTIVTAAHLYRLSLGGGAPDEGG